MERKFKFCAKLMCCSARNRLPTLKNHSSVFREYRRYSNCLHGFLFTQKLPIVRLNPYFVVILKIDKKFHFDHDEGQDLAKMTTTTHYQRRLLLLLMHISCVDALEEKMFIFISM